MGLPTTTPATSVTVARTLEELAPHRTAWDQLVANALEPNFFYEPLPLLLALEHLCPARSWQVVLIYRGERLIGLVPLQPRLPWRGGGRLVLELLRYRHSFLHTPLFDRDAADLAMRSWLDWCRRQSGTALVVCSGIGADGPLWRRLTEVLDGAGQLELARYERPVLVLDGDADTYLKRALSGNRRRELGRQRRQLEAQGKLEFCVMEPGHDPKPWIDGFLELEASGWKGRGGSALACSDGDRRFFAELVAGMHRSEQVLMVGLKLDGRWIAISNHFRAAPPNPGSFAFKTAFDEGLRSLSPGIQLEVEAIRHFFSRCPDLAWMDSCTRPENTLISKLWLERRTILRTILAVPGPRGRVALAALRAGRQARAMWLAGRKPDRPDMQAEPSASV